MKKVLFVALAIFFAIHMEAKCNGNQITMGHSTIGSTHSGGCDYTLSLYDEDGEVAYSVFVPAGTTQIVLPSTLSGSFELRFETDSYYYYGYIEL